MLLVILVIFQLAKKHKVLHIHIHTYIYICDVRLTCFFFFFFFLFLFLFYLSKFNIGKQRFAAEYCGILQIKTKANNNKVSSHQIIRSNLFFVHVFICWLLLLLYIYIYILNYIVYSFCIVLSTSSYWRYNNANEIYLTWFINCGLAYRGFIIKIFN